MPSPDNSSLNIIRHYRFTFFDLLGNGEDFFIQPISPVVIQDSMNFSFSYSVNNSILNTAKFNFYNMTKSGIDLFSSQQNRRGFILKTWYGNDNSGDKTLFSGLTYTVNTYRQGPDIITEVVGCDLFLNILLKGVNLSFPAGTTQLVIVQTLLQQYGGVVSLNAISEGFLNYVQYKSPKTFKGQLFSILKIIAADSNLIFSTQLNTITMIPSYLSINTPNAIQLISSTNGLVGTVRAEALSVQLLPVTFFNNQNLDRNLSILTVNTLLRHYNLYDKVQLESEQFNGYYGILGLTHSGEWRGNNWYSTLRLWPDNKSN